MPDIWLILLVLAGVFAIIAAVVLATGNKPWSNNSEEPTYTPAGPGAEGMNVMGAGEIGSGAPEDGSESDESPKTRRR